MPLFNSIIVDLGAGTLIAELRRRAEVLERRIRVFAADAEGFAWPEGTAASTVAFYADGLRTRDPEIGQEILTTLVGEDECLTDAFWGTELGRALFAIGVFHDVEVTRLLAQTILGIGSRQRIHQLVVNGELVESQGLMISAESVRNLMTVK